MSEEIQLQTHEDFIDRTLRTDAQDALHELLWNACDADATEIQIRFIRNEADTICGCIVSDNGTGIDRNKFKEKFEFLGYSDKKSKNRTVKGRLYHGKLGQGRYRALSVAKAVEWNTVYLIEGKCFSYAIKINSNQRKNIVFTEQQEISTATSSGTVVTLYLQDNKGNSFEDIKKTEELIVCTFAPYLKSYEDIKIILSGQAININNYIENMREDELIFLDYNGSQEKAKLITIKWKESSATKTMHFCNEEGSLIETGPYLKDINKCDCYLCTRLFNEPQIYANLSAYQLDDVLRSLVDDAIALAQNFAESLQEKEIFDEIRLLKENNIYPYQNIPQNDTEKAEQKQFSIMAVEINKIVPQLRKSTKSVKKLTYALLKETVKSSPDIFTEILNSVVALSDEQKQELAKLLKQTSLSAIIKTSQLLLNRMIFLDALYLMVYDDGVERHIKERTQFQKILLDNLWIFGEDYTYGADDVSVRNLLKKYVDKLERSELADTIPEEGAYNLDKIPDICLFNKYPLGENRFKNLVVEIKKPKKVLGKKEYDQIVDYSDIITDNAAFPGITTKWHFILVGKAFNDYVKKRLEDNEIAYGKGNIINNINCKVTILSWGEIIQNNKIKIEYLRQALAVQITDESEIISYLHENYGKYLSDLE